MMYFLILQCTWCFPIPAVLLHSFPSPAMSSCPQLPNQITSKPNSNVPVSWKSFWLLTEKSPRLPQNVYDSPEWQVPCTVLLLGYVLSQLLDCRFLWGGNLVSSPMLCSHVMWNRVNRKPIQKHTLLMQQQPKPKRVPSFHTVTYQR